MAKSREVSSLAEFSSVINRLGRAADRQATRDRKAFLRALPDFKASLLDMGPEQLLNTLIGWSGSSSDPRMTVVRQKYYTAAEAECLRRMR